MEHDKRPELMTTKEAAEYLRLSSAGLLNLVSQGKIPYRKLGRSNRYVKEELKKILDTNKRGPNSYD